MSRRFNDERPDTGTPTWTTLTDAAAAVGVSSKTIRRAVKAGTIHGQRAGDSQNSPWLVRLEDVEARWGDKAPAAGSSGVVTPAQRLETSAELLNAARTAEAEARERAIKAETENQQLQKRLSELRERLVISEPRRRWWQRPSR